MQRQRPPNRRSGSRDKHTRRQSQQQHEPPCETDTPNHPADNRRRYRQHRGDPYDQRRGYDALTSLVKASANVRVLRVAQCATRAEALAAEEFLVSEELLRAGCGVKDRVARRSRGGSAGSRPRAIRRRTRTCQLVEAARPTCAGASWRRRRYRRRSSAPGRMEDPPPGPAVVRCLSPRSVGELDTESQHLWRYAGAAL